MISLLEQLAKMTLAHFQLIQVALTSFHIQMTFLKVLYLS